jgi:hypothetical protein
VKLNMKRADDLSRSYRLPSVPTLAIDGRYLIPIADDGNFNDQLEIANTPHRGRRVRTRKGQVIAMRLLELRTYRLKPGTGPTLHDAFIRKGIPLVKQAGMDVVAFGFSADDPDGYFLMRVLLGTRRPPSHRGRLSIRPTRGARGRGSPSSSTSILTRTRSCG